MKSFFLAFAGLLIFQTTSAQSYFQKLQSDYQHSNADTDRVFALCELGDYYTWLNSDSAFLYASRAIELSDKIKFVVGRYLGLRVMCFAMIATGNYPKALEIALRKLKLVEQFKGYKESFSWCLRVCRKKWPENIQALRLF